MRQKLLKPLRLRVLMLVALLCAGFTSAWGGEVTLALWTFTSESYPANKTNFTATSGPCEESTFYLNGTGSTWNTSKGYAFTAVTDITITLKTTIALPAGTEIKFSANTFYNKASNAPMTGFNLTASENGGNYSTTGLNVSSFSLSTSDAKKECVYTLQNDLAVGKTVAIKYTQTGKAGAGQGYFNNISIAYTPADNRTPVTLSFPKETWDVTLGGGGLYPALSVDPAEAESEVIYTSSNTNVADVASNGVVNPKAAGTTTITASITGSETYQDAEASYELTVIDPNAPGTQNNPYTVAQAIENTPSTGTSEDVYIKGIVLKFYGNDILSDGGNYRYYISDDGTTNSQLLVYKGKGLNNVAFSNANDLQVGDEVVIYGKLRKYTSIYEIEAGNFIVSLTRKEVPTLTFSEDQYSVVKNGNLTITATSNSSGTITYTSSNTDVAEVNATTGAITAKTAGTTNITATIAATDDYKSATATVELTVTAPKHTVTFYQNGTKLSEEEVVEDVPITFPEATAKILGKSFIGWAVAEIEGETNNKPSLVSSATMGENDLTYYAVYANVDGEEFTATLSNDEIIANFTNDKMAYGTPETFVDGNVTWIANAYADQPNRPWFQMKKASADAYLKIASDLNISEIKLTITSANNSSGGITDITKHTVFEGKVYLESEASGSPEGTLGLSDVISNNSVTLVPNSSVNEIYIQPSAAARIWGAEVTCGNATYSGYCTTVKEQATIRLYLPNNPEGNLTEHQLSCSSTVILNVDTNSPGAITIQDMTDGITVKPNTENKTVTLLASTNNGKVFSQPGEYTFRVVVGETDSYTSASVDFKLKVVKFRAYFNNLTGFEETKDLANGTNGGQLKDQLFSNTQWGDASYKTWTSTNENVATIDNDGNITLISTGQVRFIHSYTGNDYNEPCKISTGVMTVIDTTPVAAPAKPIVFHDGGEGVTYEGELTVPMFAEEGATIYYTTDGTEPTAASTEYTKPLNISTNTTLKAIAVKDGVESDVVTREYRIEAVDAPDINLDGYYSIKNNNGNYVNVAGRKTVTFVDKNTSKTAAGTVIRVKTTNGKVEVLRSQGVDVPRYAERAMSYVPELVKEFMKRLSENVENPIIGEDGANLITDEVMDLDYNLYLEEADGGYRIYGKTPSMQRVVDFYATNKTIIDERLPRLEEFVEDVLLKVAERLDHPNSEWASKFKILDIWAKLVVTNPDLTKPEEGNAEAISKFYTEILSSEANIWNFAHETMMIYWKKVDQLINDPESQYASMLGDLGDYKKYLEKVPNILPNFKYYIVSDGSGIDFISEGNEDIINDAARTVWTLEGRENFNVTFLKDNALSSGRELYTTLYTDFAYKLPDGVKAYAITGVNETTGVATKEEFPSNIIPAQTPVLLQATFDAEQTADQTKTLELTTEAGTTPETNLLVGADYLINEYEINSPTAEGMFTILATLSQSLADKYEYLKRKNAGTVNNKYFFGLDDADLDLCVENKDCVVRNLGTGENQPLAFYGDWQAPKSNQAFLVSETFNPILLTLKGDVYRDGVIDNKDLTALVEIVLGKVTLENKPENYDFDAAHVNEDEDINIADVTALVNILKPQPQTNN